jgi:hypothetical protein
MNWQRGWNGILDEMTPLLHKLSIDPSIVLLSHGSACPRGVAAWGAGRPVGPAVRALAFCEAAFGRADF